MITLNHRDPPCLKKPHLVEAFLMLKFLDINNYFLLSNKYEFY